MLPHDSTFVPDNFVNFDCAMFNARSLYNKCIELSNFASVNCPAVMFITETHLDATVDSAIFNLGIYTIFRNDRNRSGGGVAIIVKNSFQPILISATPNFELVVVDITISQRKVRLICVYKSDNSLDYLISLLNQLDSVMNCNHPIVIAGDFNMPGIDFSSFSCSSNIYFQEMFLEYIVQRGFTQYVFEPTHVAGNTLDLVFCNVPNFVQLTRVGEPLSHSCDHLSVLFSLDVHPAAPEETFFLNYRKTNYDLAKLFLQAVNWDNAFSSCVTVHDFWEIFINIIETCVKLYVPLQKRQHQLNTRTKLSKRCLRLRSKKKYFMETIPGR